MNKIFILFVLLTFKLHLVFAQTAKCYELYMQYGMERFEESQYDKAAYNFQNAATCVDRPANGDWQDWLRKSQRCMRMVDEGNRNFDRNRYDKAKQMYQEVVLMNPADKHAKERVFVCERLITANNVYAIRALEIKTEGLDAGGNLASLASQIQEIRSCFSLTKNDFTRKGLKEIYILITDPNGMLLGKEENLFIFQGLMTNYSGKTEIEYNGELIDVCVSWKRATEQVAKGIYHLDIFLDENIVGSMDFQIR